MVFFQIIIVVVMGQLISFTLDAFNKKDLASILSTVVVLTALGIVLVELLDASVRIAELFKKEGE